MQWHPLFAQLMRPLLESHYDIQTNVPVGDAPREADLVVLRRTSAEPPPFQGLWQWLTIWNIIEFKGPTVSPRVDDLDLLVELGLGIHRRLNEERARQRQPRVGRAEVSLWYLGKHLGRRFLRAARAVVGPLEELAAGVWRAQVCGRPLLLVSNRLVALDRDSLPLHLLTPEPPAAEDEVLRVLRGYPELWQLYASWLATLHPVLSKEIVEMKKAKRQAFGPNVVPLFKLMGMPEVIRQIAAEGLIDQAAVKTIIDQIGVKPIIDQVGVKPIIDQVGVKPIIDQVGPESIIEQLEVEDIAAHLSAEQWQELLRLRQAGPPPAKRGRKPR
jgi:hypothetical protein